MRMRRLARRTVLIGLAALIAVSAMVVGCGGDGKQSTAAREREVQQTTLEKALDTVPPHEPTYFQSRLTINRYMAKIDVPQKEWYCYLVSGMGTIFGYFIFDAYPLSIGVGMTNPQQAKSHQGNPYTMPAPGIDGVYWAGADPAVTYSFDALTDAMMQWNVDYIMSDQPLDIDVPLLQVKQE